MPKNLYIVGAGASKEVNLPTGKELKQKIAQLLDIKYGEYRISGDQYIEKSIRIHAKEAGNLNIQPYLDACQQIKDAMPLAISIDNFIDTHNGNKEIELCGKLAIAQAILSAERNSLFKDRYNIDNKLDFPKIEETWYVSFLKLLTENCTKKNLSTRLKSIAFIVFNYDRCIEHFLYNAFQTYYGITPQESAKFVNEIEIYHPYGTVGGLPWQYTDKSIEFGAEPSPQQLLDLAGKIKTFTEGTDTNSSEIGAIRNSVSRANNIIFLGFSFHKLNMELMSPNALLSELLMHSDVESESYFSYFGTAKGMSDSDCDIIKSELVNFRYKNAINLNLNNDNKQINNELTCADLFNEYWRSLSLN